MESDNKRKIPKILVKALKAAAKGVVIYAIYFVVSLFLAPVSEFIPGFQQMIETFVMIYIVFVVIAELTSDSIFQHFFNGAKVLFVIAYLMLSLRTGIFGVTIQNVNLLIDFRLFLMVAVLLELVNLAKSMLQAVNYMNERTELTKI
jgi:uncharacterized ion transporter superfamily protein YfcC